MTTLDASRINRILSERGILESAVANGWQAQGERGWRYPVFDLDGGVIGYRLKLLQGEQKYLWSPAKPKHALSDWYILPETTRAIAANDGLCYLANGEPALHAYHEGGVKNAIATTLSEVAVPANAVDILRQLGVIRFVSIVDNDYAGYKSAIAWRDALRGSGIDYEAATWGEVQANKIEVDKNGNEYPYIACDDIAAKADGNDVWKLTRFDNAAFKRWVAGVIALPLPVPQEKPQQAAQDFDKTPQGLIDAILSAAEARGFKGHTGKEWVNGKSIFRDEKRKSFGIHKETGIGYDFALAQGYSTHTVAEQLNIDWQSYYPVYTPKAPDFTPEQIADSLKRLEKVVKEDTRRIYKKQDETFRREMSAKYTAWQNGDYRSWWDTPVPPKGMITTLLNLANTRSETTRVLVLMHHAFKTGRLNWVMFTETDVCDALDLDRAIVKNAFNDLLEWSFVRFLSGGYLKEILHSETTQNLQIDAPTTGRRPKWYTLNFDLDTIASTLYERLETVMLEKVFRRTYAKRTGKVADALGIESFADFQALQRRSEIAVQTDPDAKFAAQKYQMEMDGDGTYWLGWRTELASPVTFPIDISTLESIKDLRGQLLLYWIDKVCNENTREDLRRLVGGSDSTLQNLYDDFNIATEQQFERLDIKAEFADLRPMLRETQQKYRGMVRKISFKKQGEKGWQVQELNKAAYNFARDSHKITRVFMLVCKPSKQRFMSEEEIEIKLAEAVANGEPDSAATAQPADMKPKAFKSPTNRTHGKKFKQYQSRLDVFMFTPYKLVSDVVLDDEQNVIFKAQDDIALMRWLADNTQVLLVNKRTGEQTPKLLKDIPQTPIGYELRPLRMSCELRGKPFVDTDGAIMRVLHGKRDEKREALETARQAPIVLQQKVMAESAPRVELTERQKQFMAFCDTRYEREYGGGTKTRFSFMQDSQDKREAA